MSSLLIDSNSIALLTLGINYPGIFVKPSVGSKATNDGQSEVFFVPLKTEGIYEKLVEDVKRKKITGSVQAKITGKPHQTDLDSICLKGSANQVTDGKEPAQQDQFDLFRFPAKRNPGLFFGTVNNFQNNLDDEESMRKHRLYRIGPGLNRSIPKDCSRGEEHNLFDKTIKAMHYVAGPKYVEEPVAPRGLDEDGQEKTGQEVPASSLKDMDEKLGYKKKESEELAANGF